MERAVFDHDLAAHDGRHRPSVHLPAFPGTVVALVQFFPADLPADGGIEDLDVGVGACGDGAIAGVEAHQLRGVGRADVDDLIDPAPAAADQLVCHACRSGY